MNDAIEVRELTKRYRRGARPALDRVSVTFRPGTVTAVVGPNGAGKTTLAACLAGLVRPDAGTVRFGGLPPDRLEVRAATGYMPERLAYDRWMTGRAFLAYQHELARLGARRRRDDVGRALERAGIDERATARPLRTYSRGMLQRVGLASAFLGAPRYVLLDEPTSGIDPAGLRVFLDLVDEARARGAAVVVNSHDLAALERCADEVVFVSGGRVAEVSRDAGREARRTVVVRLLEPLDGALLAGAVARAGAELLGAGDREARCAVDGDRGAAALVESLTASGGRVCEVAPVGSRLEALFEGAEEAAR